MGDQTCDELMMELREFAGSDNEVDQRQQRPDTLEHELEMKNQDVYREEEEVQRVESRRKFSDCGGTECKNWTSRLASNGH